MQKKCENKACIKEEHECTQEIRKVCWHGYKMGECPLKRLENEKLLFGALLSIATGLLIYIQI